jgi:hypothetical protein
MAARMPFRAAGSSWRKALRARGRAWTAYSLIRSVPELGFEFVKRDRLAGLIPGGVSLGGVLGVLGGAERLDHRLRDDGRDALTSDRQVSDNATARVRHRCPYSVTVSGNVPNRITHSSQCTKAGSGCRVSGGRNSAARSTVAANDPRL